MRKLMYPGAVVLAALIGVVGAGVIHQFKQDNRRAARFARAPQAVVFNGGDVVNAPAANFEMPGEQAVPAQPAAPIKSAYRFSGPFTQGNLSVFLVHGENQLDTSNYLTLDEAMARRVAFAHDQGQVLGIENRSGNESVVVFAGDVLEGGYQDRVARYDVVASALASRVAVPVFCVEATRSRGPEGTFRSNPDQLASQHLRLATRLYGNQAQVWNAVTKVQDSLAVNAGVPTVKNPQSAAQLTFSLKHQAVRESADRYVRHLQSAGTGQNDVIGYALAINGKVRAVDVYGSADLFRKVWPKLLRASAIEAVAESNSGPEAGGVGVDDVQCFLLDVDHGQAKCRDVSGMRLTTQESTRAVLFESRNPQGDSWIRRNYLAKVDSN